MNNKHIYSREFKLKHFGDGEWIDEPDEVEFEYEEIKCKIVRIVLTEAFEEESYFGGYLCGYISLPESHPLFGKTELNLKCWGDITFVKETKDGWTIGFDCAHADDLIPSINLMIPIENLTENFQTYKNIDFCIKQCKSLVNEAKKADL